MTGEHKDIKVTLIRTLDLKESAQGRIKLEGGSFKFLWCYNYIFSCVLIELEFVQLKI